jgi:hypothetical protein
MPPAIFAALAALGGLIIGGLSVLGVVVAVTQPPGRDAPAGSAVFDGPHVVDTRPAATAQSFAPLAPQSAPLQAAPVQAQTPSPADVLRETWPVNASAKTSPAKTSLDALSARGRDEPDTALTTDQTPGPPSPATLNAQGTNISDNDKKNSGQDAANQDAANSAHKRRASHLAASRNAAPLSLAPNAPPTNRRGVMPPANDQQARGDVGDEASPQAPRPLFDFFGRPDDRYDHRNTPDADTETDTLPQPVQTGRFVHGRNQIVRQQPRVMGQDQDTASPPAQNDNWGSFFGHDNWNDDRRD